MGRPVEVCRRAGNTPSRTPRAGTWVEEGPCRHRCQPPAPGRIIYFSNWGRAEAGSTQPLPVSAGSASAEEAGLRRQEARPRPPAPRAREARCWRCRSSGGWAWCGGGPKVPSGRARGGPCLPGAGRWAWAPGGLCGPRRVWMEGGGFPCLPPALSLLAPPRPYLWRFLGLSAACVSLRCGSLSP